MFCVIQQVMLKKPNPCGEYREIEAYQNEWRIAGDERPCTWSWRYTGGRFERPHLEAYKISIHHSYRENGAVRKRQYSVCTMSYYDICESWWGDCIIGGENALAEKIGMGAAELCEIIDTKLEPLRERLEAEFHQSAEYIAKQEHRRVLDANREAQEAFCKRYGVDRDEYDRCYDVFGVLIFRRRAGSDTGTGPADGGRIQEGRSRPALVRVQIEGVAMTINSRIDRLMNQLAQDSSGKITVTFSDGSKRRLTGGECVDLVMNSPDKVGRFEACGKGCGLLPDFLNGLLEV